MNTVLLKRRIKTELLHPGDIVLTASTGKVSKLIRRASRGIVSHAMICVQYGSIIDSTEAGVQAHNIQREIYSPEDSVLVLRLRKALSDTQLRKVIDFARSEVGTRYSKTEAARSVIGGPKPRTRQMFCSRLVAKAYASAGVNLVSDPDYCTPEALRVSSLLVEISNMTEPVSEAELAAWAARSNPIAKMQEAQNTVLNAARRFDPAVENFNDIDRLVQAHPEWDNEIAQVYRDSGYLDIWKTDFAVNPWHYDLGEMERIATDSIIENLRAYCVSTIQEYHTGGLRFAVNLVQYRQALRANRRRTTEQLVVLYDQLVRNDQRRSDVALEWLKRRFPEDVDPHLQRIMPHSELWFSIIDQVEPNLGQIARASIKSMGSIDVCSSCGDPANDYLLVNSFEAMPGVPSLRLCSDCVEIRRARGEILEPLD